MWLVWQFCQKKRIIFVELYISKIKYVCNLQNTKNIALKKTLNHIGMYWAVMIRKPNYSNLEQQYLFCIQS